MAAVIRRARPADAPVLVEFTRRVALESEGRALDVSELTASVAAGLADPARARYFVAEEGGAVVGQMMITTEWSDWSNRWVWWIQSAYVLPAARRRGVFRALYEHVCQAARNEPGVSGLRLYVERSNHTAQETYRRLGMEETQYLVFERLPL